MRAFAGQGADTDAPQRAGRGLRHVPGVQQTMPRTDRALRWRLGLACVVACGLGAPLGAAAQDRVPLARLLTELGQNTRTEVLFDEAVLSGLSGRRPPRGLPVEAALRRLLAGTGLEFSRLPGGGYVLFKRSANPVETLDEPAVAEILVIGRRLLNADLPRSPNGVQPYRVVTRGEVQSAHRDNIDQFFRARVPANADVVAPAQNVTLDPAEARSNIDLRGVGANRTLILIDGRRLPRLPIGITDLAQSDLNSIPVEAIERIEVITSTAGGIYGPDATGGVVNVVLRRDYRGTELTVSSGITDRGDAARLRIAGRAGWTSNDGATQLMLFGAYSFSDRFRVGQRDYAVRARERGFAHDPEGYLSPNGATASMQVGNSITFTNQANAPLMFDTDHGGGSLGARITYLPLDFRGTEQERRELLLRNAGKIDTSLSPGASGADRTLMTTPRVISGVVSAHHQFGGDGPEIFLDGLYTHSTAGAINPYEAGSGALRVTSPDNPFTRLTHLRYPRDLAQTTEARREMFRLTAGVIVPLSGTWRAEGDVTFSRVRQSSSVTAPMLDAAFYEALATGDAGAGGRPAVRPLADWQAFRAALPFYVTPIRRSYSSGNTLISASLRAGGPVIDLPGGALSLSLLAERRQEKMPDSVFIEESAEQVGIHNGRTLDFSSGYLEASAPLVTRDSGFFPLRGLELQLAARFDRLDAQFARSVIGKDIPLISISRNAPVYTVGARVRPVPQLMLRASYATGQVTPEVSQFQSVDVASTVINYSFADPKRGGRQIGSELPYVSRGGGSDTIQQELAATLAVGAVINPGGRGRPRLSIDYSRISTRRRIENAPFAPAMLVSMEAAFPDRVIRASLSEADRLLGFTGGPIIIVDGRMANTGRSILHSFDLEFEWRAEKVAGGVLTPYASATWQPSFRVRRYTGTPWIERSGFRDGPVEWRGNGGIRWERGRFGLDLNLQYVGGYRISYGAPDYFSLNPALIKLQGSERIPAQAYVDLAASWSLVPDGGALREIDFRFGIQNLFDHSPPIIAEIGGMNYSFHGDPRRRRVELSVSILR